MLPSNMATIEELLDPQDEELGNVESPENVEGPENVQGPENVEGPGNVEGLGNVEGPVTDLVKKRSSIAEVEKTSTYTIRPKFEKKYTSLLYRSSKSYYLASYCFNCL